MRISQGRISRQEYEAVMVAARKPIVTCPPGRIPAPPPQQLEPVIHASHSIKGWLAYYWQKLHLPPNELGRLAVTQDRQEYMCWTGKRLQAMVLGCYCYLPPPHMPGRSHRRSRKPSLTPPLPAFEEALHPPSPSTPTPQAGGRHLIFIEPDMQPQSIEVTVAHELIHLADRVNGTPRRHRHHGYDSIAADEAAITGYALEDLRRLLHEESMRRERARRARRPLRYLYECPNCGKQYPRSRRYSQAVSCSNCDKSYNPLYRLALRTSPGTS